LKNPFGTEVRVSIDQQRQLKAIADSHPAVVAARQVLQTQILAGGVMLRRDGKVADMQPVFKHHFNTHWIPFAKDVLESLIMFGFVVVTYEMDAEPNYEDDDYVDPATLPLRMRKHVGTIDVSNEQENARGKSKRKREKSDLQNSSLQANEKSVIPAVAELGTYEIAFDVSGRCGMKRVYKIYRKQRDGVEKLDDATVLFVRDPPNQDGTINSSMASVSGICNFVDKIVDMTLVAEEQRSRPPIVTQARPTPPKTGPSSNDMFFDSESREMLRENQNEDDETAAMALKMQIELCRVINSVRNGGASSAEHARAAASASEIGSRMFALPVNQESTNVMQPQSRQDLAELVNMANEHICTAIGVPASLLFETRFASQSSAQLSLLNSTVQQLASRVNSILTSVYIDIHGSSGPDSDESSSKSVNDVYSLEVVTTTSAMVSPTEVLQLYTGGLVDFDAAAPLALHAIGVPNSDIDQAMQRHADAKEKEKELEAENRKMESRSKDVELKLAEKALASNPTSKAEEKDPTQPRSTAQRSQDA